MPPLNATYRLTKDVAASWQSCLSPHINKVQPGVTTAESYRTSERCGQAAMFDEYTTNQLVELRARVAPTS